MNESIGGFQSNMRITYKWAVLVLVIMGMILIAISDLPRNLFVRTELQYLAIFSYISAGLVFITDRWKSWLGQCFLITLLTLMQELKHRHELEFEKQVSKKQKMRQ